MNVPDQTKGTLWAVLQTTATSALLAALTLGGSVLAARLLGASGRGELAEAQVIPSLIGSFGLIGMNEAAVYFAAAKREQSARIVATALAIGLVSTGVALLLLILAIGYFPGRATEAFATYALIIPLMALVGIPNSSLRAMLRFDLWNRLRLIPPLMWVLALMAGFLISGTTVVTLVRIQVVATCAFGCVQLFLIRQAFRGKFELDGSYFRPLLVFGLSVLGSQLPQLAAVRIDQVLVASMFSSDRVGHYFVALGWSAIPTLLLQAAGSIAFPKVASIDDVVAKGAAIARLARTSVASAILVTIPALILTPFALPFLYGAEFRESTVLASILIVASAIRGSAQVLQEAARGLGYVGAIVRSELCALAVLVVLLWPLQSRYGLVGVALTAVGASLSSFWMVAFLLRSRTHCSWRSFLIPTAADVRMTWKEFRRIAGLRAPTGNRP